MSVDRDLIGDEIQRLHDFFTEWFNGSLAGTDDVYDTYCGNHLSADFLNVQPGGARLTREVFNAAIKSGYGVNPDFKILIRNAEIRLVIDEGRRWLVTYEEYQRGAKSSSPCNARFSTLLIERLAPDAGIGMSTGDEVDGASAFLWHHIHETWLPQDHHAPELFEF